MERPLEKRIEQIVQITALVALIIGCLFVLRPFVTALLGAAIMCFSTWPAYRHVERLTGSRPTLAALTMTLLLILLVVLPLALIAASLSDSAARAFDWLRTALASGLPAPPDWVRTLPLVGGSLDASWRALASPQELEAALQRFAQPAQQALLKFGVMLGEGVLQLSLVSFIGFFLYRDGAALLAWLQSALQRVSGALAPDLLRTVGGTIRGVVYGVLGTALAQGVLAALGLWIASVPAAALLGLLTFLLSMLPVGPPLVWGGAAAWLFYRGEIGWAVFMALYGLIVVSGIDNVLKPLLISRGSRLPFLLVFLGVLGGIIAFGFIGAFLGPTLLAVGYALACEWARQRAPSG
ncbi:MAG TPA: AI-2E family transporter [Burkholderiales bacterium]|nr:AI-2E family transporter [Burkholderiales bacterium]